MTTIHTIEDLIRILDERPEWNEALRVRMLSRELLNLPQAFAEFAENTERRLAALESALAEFIDSTNRRLAALEEGQARLEGGQAELREGQARLEGGQAELREGQTRLEGGQAELREGQTRLEGGQAELREGQARLEGGQAELREGQARLEGGQAELREGQARLEGGQAELREGQARLENDAAPLKAAHARNGALRITRRIARTLNCWQIRLVEGGEILDAAGATAIAGIPRNELDSFELADIIIEAEHRDSGETCYVAVEVSYTASRRDTDRAIRNAGFLTRFTGRPAYPVIVSQRVRPDIEPLIESGGVNWLELPSEALETD